MESKLLLVFMLMVTQIVDGAEQNNTETAESARLVQDSYMQALVNSRKGALSKTEGGVTYVTAANQGIKSQVNLVNSGVQHVVKVTPSRFVKADNGLKPFVVNVQDAKKVLPTLATIAKDSKVATVLRREDSNYDTGPNAEPYNYNAFTSNDGYSNQQQSYNNGYENSGSDSYLPQPVNKYGLPNKGLGYKKFGKQQYGVPDNSYGPPSYNYGPPAPVYGPPLKPSYGVPYGMTSFFDKFSLKLDLVTLAKIILKLIIFKKIVKFIAVICLLLFIPKLIHIKKNKDEEDEDEEGRKILSYNVAVNSVESLNTLSAFVQHSIATYSLQQRGCENVGCRIKRVLDKVDEDYTLSSMVDLFSSLNEK